MDDAEDEGGRRIWCDCRSREKPFILFCSAYIHSFSMLWFKICSQLCIFYRVCTIYVLPFPSLLLIYDIFSDKFNSIWFNSCNFNTFPPCNKSWKEKNKKYPLFLLFWKWNIKLKQERLSCLLCPWWMRFTAQSTVNFFR